MENENYIVLDTETTNGLEQPLVYDIGFIVCNSKGEILEKHSYAIDEVINDTILMKSAYYKEKLPIYQNEINNGERILTTLGYVKKAIAGICKHYNIKHIYAHNANFDYRSCTNAQRYITKSAIRYFFPYDIEICDTLKYAREVMKKNNHYRHFCKENNFLTKTGNNQLKAEILFRYISKDINFDELHMGLADVLIENEILRYCLKHMPDFDARLWTK